jgi:DNA repair exonuclease SbcCD ATPase subunit
MGGIKLSGDGVPIWQVIEEFKDKIKAQEAEIKKRKEELDEFEATLKNRGQNLDAREGKLDNKEKELEERESQVGPREVEVAKKEKELSSLDASLRELQDELNSARVTVEKRDKDLTQKRGRSSPCWNAPRNTIWPSLTSLRSTRHRRRRCSRTTGRPSFWSEMSARRREVLAKIKCCRSRRTSLPKARSWSWLSRGASWTGSAS